jgi:hypothetical protein
MIIGLMAALAYALVANNTVHRHGGVVLWVSLFLFAMSAVAGGACVVLSVEEA